MGIETALLGSAVFGPATAGAVAAAGSTGAALAGMSTAGLLGGSSLLTGLSALSSLSSLVGGVQGQQAGNYQSEIALAEAKSRGAESARVAQREARLTQEDALATERRQKLAYLASGVTLEGSPLLVMEETRRKGQENVDEILNAGKAASEAALAEGRLQASSAKSAGRQSFISGLTNAASTGINAYSALK